MIMNEDKNITFAGHNYKGDYKFKITHGLKADGYDQLKELRVMSDESEGLLDISFDLLEDWYAKGKQKHIKMVSPYEKGFEPNV